MVRDYCIAECKKLSACSGHLIALLAIFFAIQNFYVDSKTLNNLPAIFQFYALLQKSILKYADYGCIRAMTIAYSIYFQIRQPLATNRHFCRSILKTNHIFLFEVSLPQASKQNETFLSHLQFFKMCEQWHQRNMALAHPSIKLSEMNFELK